MKFPANRPRLVLVVPPSMPDSDNPSDKLKALEKALSGGDVASVILDSNTQDEASFQSFAEQAVDLIQQAHAAAIIFNDTRTAGRVGADGVHIEGSLTDISEAIERYTPKLIVGTGNVRERHVALEVGELLPDYMFFGKIGADNKAEAHSRNLNLAEWWAAMVEIPCIVQAGNNLDSIESCINTGAEFIALGQAVFHAEDPALVVAEANRIIDALTPVLDS